MARKNPETVVASGFSEPISFSVRNVGCGDRTGFSALDFFSRFAPRLRASHPFRVRFSGPLGSREQLRWQKGRFYRSPCGRAMLRSDRADRCRGGAPPAFFASPPGYRFAPVAVAWSIVRLDASLHSPHIFYIIRNIWRYL